MTKRGRYEAVRGINYVPDGGTDEVRREPGERFDDPPAVSLAWLLAEGVIRDTTDAAPEKEAD